ncbi:hypothetical protein [Cupriavidus sp. SIMBA_020]|uniref:hypothetical protein n=1 Tax=Cupriavidus sp. SIMBA_020 TaxID=3085766 RepID=UPI003979D27A
MPSNLGLTLRLALHRQNWLIWIGTTLVISAAILHWAVRPRLEAQNRQTMLAIQASLAQRDAAGSPGRAVGPDELSAQHAKAFTDALANEQMFPQHLSALLGYAKDAGLTLAEADYDHASDAKGGLALQGVGLPLRGSYGALRMFCEATLMRMPFASLDAIQLKRGSIAADALEAKLHLTLYQRGTAAEPESTSSGQTANDRQPASKVSPTTAGAP